MDKTDRKRWRQDIQEGQFLYKRALGDGDRYYMQSSTVWTQFSNTISYTVPVAVGIYIYIIYIYTHIYVYYIYIYVCVCVCVCP